MIRTVLTTVALLIGATTALPAQAGNGPLDSARAGYRADLILLRDSLARVSAASFRVQRDLRSAGDETLQAQVSRLRERCTAMRSLLAEYRERFEPAAAPDSVRDAMIAFRVALDRARRDLRTQCQSWIPTAQAAMQPDSLREWGPYRLNELDQAIGAYHAAVAQFARRVGFRMPPRAPR